MLIFKYLYISMLIKNKYLKNYILIKKNNTISIKMSESARNIANFLKILSDPKRLDIIFLLKNGEMYSAQIEDATGLPQPTVSQHLKVLKNQNLITFEKRDRIKYYRIKDKFIFKILSSIRSYLININEEKIDTLQKSSIIDTLGM